MASGRSAAWHTLPAEQVLAQWRTTPRGLDTAEAQARLREHGPNEIERAKPVRPLKILLAQFESIIVWILIVAGLVSGLVGEMVDSAAILAIVLLNAVIGFLQEYRAERSLQALRKMTAPRARVRRDGDTGYLPAAEIVPGDIVELEAGDLVPGDARLIEAHSVRTNEAPLTGESEPVSKGSSSLPDAATPLADRRNMVFLGTNVAAGRGLAVVVATGMATEIGRIASLITQAAAAESTPLQRRLHAFGRMLVWASLGIVGLLFGLGLMRGIAVLDLFLASVSLAVAAVPEGLPAVVTIALAVGVQRMARRRSLVRKLHAVETLGSVNVICTDKTGTLTVGEMTVRALHVAGREIAVSGEGYSPRGEISIRGDFQEEGALVRELLETFVGCNGARLVRQEGEWRVLGDPTEGALLAAGAKGGVTLEALDAARPLLVQFPFDSDRKRMATVRRGEGGGIRILVKGAPDLLLALCTHIRDGSGVRAMTGEDRERLLAANVEMAKRALRVLAGAYRDAAAVPQTQEEAERDLVFVGLAGMYDPPRREAAQSVALCRSAGIRPVMITGDHPQTAAAVARELGIAAPETGTLSGADLDRLSDEELRSRIAEVSVYARVTAEHKLRIVRAWQSTGGIVAMTGDGVNDAPAIRGADIGIAMGRSGTEVTKEASDMVITDDNFATIVDAVEEGRGIYDNIKKTILYLLAGNTGELLLMTACVVAGMPLPLLPIQLLWINLVTDGLPALCLAVDPIDRDVMLRPPRGRRERLADRPFFWVMATTGLMTALVSYSVYAWALEVHDLATARALAFTALVFAELFKSFGFRSTDKTVWEIGLHTNLRLLAAVAASFAIQFIALRGGPVGDFLKNSRVSLHAGGLLLLLSLVPVTLLEVGKLIRRALR